MTTATKAPAAKQTYFCSFCGKAQEETRKLIAGPGVFICEECVGLCVAIMNTEGQSIPARQLPAELPTPVANLTDDELIARMVRVASSREQVDNAVGHFVRQLRRRGTTWARIGEALGMTRQSAWERYSHEE